MVEPLKPVETDVFYQHYADSDEKTIPLELILQPGKHHRELRDRRYCGHKTDSG